MPWARLRNPAPWILLSAPLLLFLGVAPSGEDRIRQKLVLLAIGSGVVLLVLVLLRTVTRGSVHGRVRGPFHDSSPRQAGWALHHQERHKKLSAGGKMNVDSKGVSFSTKLTAKYVPNASDLTREWKAKCWWQPEDFAEFLRVRVLIGRAYCAVAKRRGVKVDEDFPAEPVLAHESRLGLHLGRQGPMARNRKEYVDAVLQEQARQLYEMYDKETGTAGGPAMLDFERIAKVARRMSETHLDYAVKAAQRHHEKVLKDLTEPNEEEEQPVSPLQKAKILRRTRTRSEARNNVSKATRHRRNSTALESATAAEMCMDAFAGTVPAAGSAPAVSDDTRAVRGAGAGHASGGLRPAVPTIPPITLPLTRIMEGQISEVSNNEGTPSVRHLTRRIERQLSLQSEQLTLAAPSCSSSGRPNRSKGALRGLDLRGYGLQRDELERQGMTPTGQFACHSPSHPFLADETEEEAEGGSALGQGAEQDEEDSLSEDSLSS